MAQETVLITNEEEAINYIRSFQNVKFYNCLRRKARVEHYYNDNNTDELIISRCMTDSRFYQAELKLTA